MQTIKHVHNRVCKFCFNDVNVNFAAFKKYAVFVIVIFTVVAVDKERNLIMKYLKFISAAHVAVF